MLEVGRFRGLSLCFVKLHPYDGKIKRIKIEKKKKNPNSVKISLVNSFNGQLV